jgi:hypothetical protein
MIKAHSRAHDLARMNARTVDHSAEQLLEGQHAVPVVEPDDGQDLEGFEREVHAQKFLRQVR